MCRNNSVEFNWSSDLPWDTPYKKVLPLQNGTVMLLDENTVVFWIHGTKRLTFPYAMIVTRIPGYYDLHGIINQQYYGTITAIPIWILQRINKHWRHSLLFTHTSLYRTVKVVYGFVNTFKKKKQIKLNILYSH